MPAGYDAEVAELFRDLRSASGLTEADLAAQLATRTEVVQALEQGERIVAPAWQGQRGHPVGFSAHYCGALLALRGDEGARALLRSDPPLLLEVGDPGVVRDIDTPIDLPE